MQWHKLPTILVVDDERSVRELVVLFLETAGYTVYQAGDGREALSLVAIPDLGVDILITDIIMPFMNGRELANRICLAKPNLKVVFMSAYSADFLSGQNLFTDGADYIRKPFGKEILLERISRVWARSPKWKDLIPKQA